MPDLFQIVDFYFQPGKSLYTTVRELVENALDSSESISELPEVEVTMYVPFLSHIRIFTLRSFNMTNLKFCWPVFLLSLDSLTVLFSFESEEIGKSKFNSMIGLIDRERVDTKLYDDYETDKAREVLQLSLSLSLNCLTLSG